MSMSQQGLYDISLDSPGPPGLPGAPGGPCCPGGPRSPAGPLSPGNSTSSLVTSSPLCPAGGSTTVSSQYSRTGTPGMAWCYLSSRLVPEVLGVLGSPVVPPPRSNLRHTQELNHPIRAQTWCPYTHTHTFTHWFVGRSFPSFYKQEVNQVKVAVPTRHSCSLFTHRSSDSDVSHDAFLSRWTCCSVCTLSAATTGRFICQSGQPCRSLSSCLYVCVYVWTY